VSEMAKCITIIAMTGQGKTTFTKQTIQGNPCIVYDINGEYEDLPFDVGQARSRFFGKPMEFIDACKEKHGGTFCVFEEATGFLAGRTGLEMRQFLIGKRHPQNLGGRNIIFIFHTIASVPPFILDMSDYFVLFKTGDNFQNVKRKAPKLYSHFMRLQGAKKYSKLIIKNV